MAIPSATVSRLVTYLDLLENMELAGLLDTNSQQLAERAHLSPFKVRKDLSYLQRAGTRGKGYSVPILKREIITTLGLNRRWRVVIVGMGHLGRAIAEFPIATQYGFTYIGFFDTDPAVVGSMVGHSPIHHLSQLSGFVSEQGVDMAFLTVPAEQAQQAAEQVVAANIRSILNFTPTVLNVPNSQSEKYDSGHKKWHNVTIESIDFLAGMKRLAYATQQLSPLEVEEI